MRMANTNLGRSNNPFVVGYIVSEQAFKREEFEERNYNQFNPNLTEGVCQALAKRNCKHCYNSGLQHYNNGKNIKWEESCYCVKNKINKMEESMKHTVLYG